MSFLEFFWYQGKPSMFFAVELGASANITGIGILRKEGYEVKNKDFFKIGIPFTLAATVPAYIYIWAIYGI